MTDIPFPAFIYGVFSLCIATIVAVGAFVFYLVVEDAITTVAHVCAILMGLLFGQLYGASLCYPNFSGSYQRVTWAVLPRWSMRTETR